MDDADFLKELDEMTKSMANEFAAQENGNPNSNNLGGNFGNFEAFLNNPDENMFSQLNGLINGLNIDDNDPSVKGMMDQLSKCLLTFSESAQRVAGPNGRPAKQFGV